MVPLDRGAGRHGRRRGAAGGSCRPPGGCDTNGVRLGAERDRRRQRGRPPWRRAPDEGGRDRPRGLDRPAHEARRPRRGRGAARRRARTHRGGRRDCSPGGAGRVRARGHAARRAAGAARRRRLIARRYRSIVPELPEVETVRRSLVPLLEGRTFEEVEITDVRLTRPFDPVEVARELEGERGRLLDRRGKYLIVRFGSGRALLIHLRMTGAVLQGAADGDTHRRAVVHLDDGTSVAYRDVRRFGTWLLLEPDEVEAYVDARVGREPLAQAYRAKHLAERLEGRQAPVKAAILDQRTVAGVGNIYADEALWRARIHPLTPAALLDADEVKLLHKGIRQALQAGLRRQGSTLRDSGCPEGEGGGPQREFKVSGRGGEPCDRCGTPIDKIRVAGRGTWYCPTCQRRVAQRA